jgi:hypothetical protein
MAKFKTITLEDGFKKVLGPGDNTEEIKFEGDQKGPFYVHSKNGQPIESIFDHAEPEKGWFVRFGGTEEECYTFLTR